MASAIHVKGYRETMRAFQQADKDARKELRAALKEVGEVVRRDAAARFASTSGRTAAGYRTAVRQRGVAVEQRLAKTTGLRPDYGALQMRRALIPARSENLEELDAAMEAALDRVCDHFNRGRAVV